MAFEWLTGNSPQFWKNYVSLFDNETPYNKKRFVVFDVESSGLDWKEDNILSIGGIGIVDGGIAIGDFMYAALINPKQNNTENSVVKAETETVVEAEAMIQLLNFIGDAILVGNNINLDIEFINQALKRLDLGRLKNEVMDTSVLFKRWKGINDDDLKYTLDELCDGLKIDKAERNSSWGNAYTTALVFIKLKAILKL
ncbi:PolC-type DNA polymerase III [Flavobacterium sp. RHBU_3]|uniref:3'-5' exonuclease n=1 Tax=Flavobacterium sp. RHBU_3 TaxID=3391184 RepID=UPI0039853806